MGMGTGKSNTNSKSKASGGKEMSGNDSAIPNLVGAIANPSSGAFGSTNPVVSDGVQSLQSSITQSGNGAQMPIMANSAISSQAASGKMQGGANSLAQMFSAYNPSSLRPINGSGQAQKGGK